MIYILQGCSIIYKYNTSILLIHFLENVDDNEMNDSFVKPDNMTDCKNPLMCIINMYIYRYTFSSRVVKVTVLQSLIQ